MEERKVSMFYAETTYIFTSVHVHGLHGFALFNQSQSCFEGSCAWDGLGDVIPASLTIQVKMSTCAEIQSGYKHRKLESLGETERSLACR